MKLFKRLLLSIFPDEISNQSINPANMFISFISTKEFFSIINRKIVENYKLNLFDITIDPFESKIWFWENIHIKQKDIDIYYSYCATANMNWYRLLNPANIWNSITLITSIYTKHCFVKYPQEYFLNFLYTTYLLFFVFWAKIKIFPWKIRQEDYNRFIEVFFNFYEFIFKQTGKVLNKEEITELKKELLSNTKIFFSLFYIYKKINTTFTEDKKPSKDFYLRLFGDEFKDSQIEIINDFFEKNSIYTSKTNFWPIENKLFQSILPSDILIRYLFLETDMALITETIISKIYDKNILENFMEWFLKNDDDLEKFILYITDYRHFKKNFFKWVQKYIITVLKKEQSDNPNNNSNEDFEDINSRIWEDFEDENMENFKIPDRIKKESRIMEKILNFFVTFIWWLWISRGENFFIKLFREPLIKNLTGDNYTKNPDQKTLYFYWGMLYMYGKNIFYYKYISENVKAGRQKFYLPYKSNSKKTYSNLHILKLFDEGFLATILQDINSKDIKIYSKNKKILSIFKELLGKKISSLVNQENNTFIEQIYHNIQQLLKEKNLIWNLQKHLTTEDIYHLKENIYNIDFWIIDSLYHSIFTQKSILLSGLDDNTILWVCSILKETFFGFILYQTQKEFEDKQKKDNKQEILIDIYINDILYLNNSQKEINIRKSIIIDIQNQFKPILEILITLDDNQDFLRIWIENRKFFTDKKIEDKIIKSISWEDILRFKWYLKNITYYNKRFLTPRQ